MEEDSVIGLKDSTAGEVRNSVNPRRRLQNRIAQRKFREKAKARKQCILQSSQGPTRMSASNSTNEARLSTEHNSHGFSLQHSGASRTPVWDQCRPAQEMCLDDFSKLDLYPPIDGPYSDSRAVGSGNSTTVPQVFETELHPSQCRWDLSNPRGGGSVDHETADSRNNGGLGKPGSSFMDENKRKSEMNAVATIQKQRARLCSEGKQIIELLEELYELSVLLEIFAIDSDFPRLLSEMKNRFSFCFK